MSTIEERFVLTVVEGKEGDKEDKVQVEDEDEDKEVKEEVKAEEKVAELGDTQTVSFFITSNFKSVCSLFLLSTLSLIFLEMFFFQAAGL